MRTSAALAAAVGLVSTAWVAHIAAGGESPPADVGVLALLALALILTKVPFRPVPIIGVVAASQAFLHAVFALQITAAAPSASGPTTHADHGGLWMVVAHAVAAIVSAGILSRGVHVIVRTTDMFVGAMDRVFLPPVLIASPSYAGPPSVAPTPPVAGSLAASVVAGAAQPRTTGGLARSDDSASSGAVRCGQGRQLFRAAVPHDLTLSSCGTYVSSSHRFDLLNHPCATAPRRSCAPIVLEGTAMSTIRSGPPRTRTRWRVGTVVAMLVASGLSALALAPPASAHVTVNPGQATQGDFAKLAFRVPNESDTAGTTKLEVAMPLDTPLAFVSVRPVPGWDVEVVRSELPEPVEADGFTLTEAVSMIIWTAQPGVRIEPGQFQEFEVSGGPMPAVEAIAFPAEQSYDDGEVVSWSEPVVEGEEEPEHPAPTLLLSPADDAGGGHGGAPADPVATTDPVATPVADETPDVDDRPGRERRRRRRPARVTARRGCWPAPRSWWLLLASWSPWSASRRRSTA